MKSFCVILVLLAYSTTITCRKYGFDSTQNITVSQFACLANEGYSFFIARIYRSKGIVDDVGLENIARASEAGFHEIHGYFFPCLKSECRQSAAQQIDEAFTALEEEGLEIDKLWLDIQIENGSWGTDKKHNQAFIKELIDEAEHETEKVGIYTQNDSWKNIVGIDWNYANNKYLWYPRFNKTPEELTSVFMPFGGWKKPKLHQFDQNVKSKCDVKINRSWDIDPQEF
uniref:Lysozyme n=1 Tax=Panagrolaimus davidi TaxID=227884 RepID=A0A914QPZ4_9BILA